MSSAPLRKRLRCRGVGQVTGAGHPVVEVGRIVQHAGQGAGETDYQPATFTDSLAGVLDDAAYLDDGVASTGDLAYTSATQTLAWSGALDIGESERSAIP